MVYRPNRWPFWCGFRGDVLFGSEMPCLKDKAESIARDPDTHLDKCRIFGSNYRRWASHFEMLRTLELLRVQFE